MQEESNAGEFYVDSYNKNSPRMLEKLKGKLKKGDFSWINLISDYSAKVVGSTAYWRMKRKEVFSWLHHMVKKKEYAPMYFMTFSSAEYH